jgi:hypothetical protein
MFEKHNFNSIEDIHEPLNPKSFDLLYVTRCSDGTFALCMDSSLSLSTTTTNKISTNDQRFIISSATPNDQQQTKSPKKKIIPKKQSSIISTIKTKRKTQSNLCYHETSKMLFNEKNILFTFFNHRI